MRNLLIGLIIAMLIAGAPALTRELSSIGLELIKTFESLENQPYFDAAGHLTIGYGHKLTHRELTSGEIVLDGERIPWENGITNEQALRILERDTTYAKNCVERLVQVDLDQAQFDALVSFVFNAGCVAFANSSLLRLLNEGEYGAVADQLRRWKYANNRVLRGLIRRREAEIELWERKPSSAQQP